MGARTAQSGAAVERRLAGRERSGKQGRARKKVLAADAIAVRAARVPLLAGLEGRG